jgi:elongator complex protein 4
MSFRRYAPSKPPSTPQSQSKHPEQLPAGIKPGSPPVISTGTATLDALLSPALGLPLSSALLVEEDGTGNYGGVVLRQYVAEGVVQGNKVWIGGVGDTWWRNVPGLARESKSSKSTSEAASELEEKMKIAWRYGIIDPKGRGNEFLSHHAYPDFCHVYDISEQLPLPPNAQVTFSPPPSEQGKPYEPLIASLVSFLDTSSTSTPIRLVLPDLLNPLVYSPEATNPSSILKFLHILTGIVANRPFCTMILSISSSFYPRTSPLTSWIEHLCSHVIQLCPLPPSPIVAKHPQGLLHVYKGGLVMQQMAYRVGRRGMVLEEWSLPPLEDEAPRVKQGFVIEKEISGETGRPSVSKLSAQDIAF